MSFNYWCKQITKNKYIEFQAEYDMCLTNFAELVALLGLTKQRLCLYLLFCGFDIYFRRKADHAGLYINIQIFSLYIGFDFYDCRHWDYETNSYKVY
jgi:hypothetical protein